MWNRHMCIQEVVIVPLFLPILIVDPAPLYNFKASRTCCQRGQLASYLTATKSCSTQPRWFPPSITRYSDNRFAACWLSKSAVELVLRRFTFHILDTGRNCWSNTSKTFITCQLWNYLSPSVVKSYSCLLSWTEQAHFLWLVSKEICMLAGFYHPV